MEHITNIGKAEIPKLSVCGIEETINVEVSVMTFQIGASYFFKELIEFRFESPGKPFEFGSRFYR